MEYVRAAAAVSRRRLQLPRRWLGWGQNASLVHAGARGLPGSGPGGDHSAGTDAYSVFVACNIFS